MRRRRIHLSLGLDSEWMSVYDRLKCEYTVCVGLGGIEVVRTGYKELLGVGRHHLLVVKT